MATKNRGLAWSVAETQLLLALWNENKIQNVTDGTTNNAKVYEKFAKKLEKRGYHRTTAQIRDRMKRLKRAYKEEVDSNKTGNGKKSCHFFNELDKILGNNVVSNSSIDQDSVPMNVCQAELGKCVSSDEDEDVNNVYTHLREERKRLKRELRLLDLDTVSEDGEDNGEKSKLEVQKMMLEMEKLRQEIGLIREEREKLALEKDILTIQRQRLLREENLEWLRESQTELREQEQPASMTKIINKCKVGKSTIAAVDSDQRTESNAFDCASEMVIDLSDRNKSSEAKLCKQSSVASASKMRAEIDGEGEGCPQKHSNSVNSIDNLEVKKNFLNELDIVERAKK